MNYFIYLEYQLLGISSSIMIKAFTKISLPDVTLLGLDCVDITRLIDVARISALHIEFGDIQLLSSLPSSNHWVKKINPITSKEEYSRFMIRELDSYVKTSHVLIIQYDGFILNPSAWTNDFLQYDYIGAPWWYTEGNNVGNGGFSLRSKKLLNILKSDSSITEYHPEDLVICRNHYEALVRKGIQFAPDEVAVKFSFEGRNEQHDRWEGAFGFHGYDVTDISAWDVKAYTRFYVDRRFRAMHKKRVKAYQKTLKEWKKILKPEP